MSPWMLLAPLFVLVMGGLLIMIVDSFIREKAELSLLTALVLAVAGGTSLALWMSEGAPADAPAIFGHYLAYDHLSLFFDIVVCGGGALSALLAGGYLAEHRMERGSFTSCSSSAPLGP